MSAPYHNKALSEGATLREWRLEKVLGVGGFGIVYRGRGLYFDEVVAIKEYFPGAISDRIDETTVAPNDSSSEEVYKLGLSKFLEEAKILWNLSRPERHPNIAAVRSLFEVHGTAYMVMDFEEGVALSQLLKEGRQFGESELLAILRPIADGLDRAHKAGVLHRDIKPANILIDATGRPVLIDFGSARFGAGQATSTQVTFYTPPYAAIEQYVKTYPQGPWTDIYALGVTLYECAAGRKASEVLERMHGGGDEPLSACVRPGFSPAFVRAVEAAMAVKPADRPQSLGHWLRMFDPAATVAAADDATRIARVLDAAPGPAGPATGKVAPEQAPPPPDPASPAASRAPLAWAGAGVGALAIAGVTAFVVLQGPTKRPGPPAATAATHAVDAAAAARAAVTAVASGEAALAADVRGAKRPLREIVALDEGEARLAALGAMKPFNAAAFNQAAIDMGRAEASALARDAGRQVLAVRTNPAWTTGAANGRTLKAAAAARAAKQALDTSVAQIGSSGDGAEALVSTRRALADFTAFATALAAAQPDFRAARNAEIAASLRTARQVAAAIAAQTNAPRPSFLASGAVKQRYQLAQDDARKARTKLAELEQAAQGAGAGADLPALDGIARQLTAGVQVLQALRTSSAAATAEPASSAKR